MLLNENESLPNPKFSFSVGIFFVTQTHTCGA